MAELAALAEASGWDAIGLEDYIVYQGQIGVPTYDPWIVLAAMAVATKQIKLGVLVTPLSRRRPWKVAAEATTLDHLSEGRLILGVGAGDCREASFAAAGEPTDQRTLAERLDEGLEILAALWRGEPVSFQGRHYWVEGLQLAPAPLQKPRIPLWIGGDWLRQGVRRRLLRWDGCCVYKGTPGGVESGPMLANHVRDIVSLVTRERGIAEAFEICVGGFERGPDWDRERDHIRSLAAAGATWWNEWIPPSDLERTREVVARGPLRVDGAR
jgi:hypothetical protein